MGSVDRDIDYALVFSAAYGARQELTRLAPISREDLALEQDIERAVASLQASGLSPLEQNLAFHISMLGLEEYERGAPEDFLGAMSSGRQAGVNDGGLVDIVSDNAGIAPNQWCSMIIMYADDTFMSGINPDANPLARSHMDAAQRQGAFHDTQSHYEPQPGDRLVFSTADPNGSSFSGHIGTVLDYNPETDELIYIDGNANVSNGGSLYLDVATMRPRVSNDSTVLSGGIVGLQTVTLDALANGEADGPNHPDTSRYGTLLGFVDVRTLAERNNPELDITARSETHEEASHAPILTSFTIQHLPNRNGIDSPEHEI